MTVLSALQNRHSIRTYTSEHIPDEKLTAIIQAGLLSASSRAFRPWEFIVVRDKKLLSEISECRVGAAKMLAGADAAIVVIGDAELSDVWVEDCSIAMANMHLAADSLDVGSCWIQGRLRFAPDGTSTDDYLRKILGYPEKYRLEAILSLGMPQKRADKTELAALHTEKVHYNKF